jgi:hypothetical protein
MGKTGLKFVVGRSPIIKGPAARGGSVFFSRHAAGPDNAQPQSHQPQALDQAARDARSCFGLRSL